MMKNKKVGVFSLAVGLFMASGSLFAHHSDAAFDREHLVTIKGTVTRYFFSNPHVQIYIRVKEANGQFRIWTTQAQPPAPMRKAGWDRDILKPGDEVKAWGFANRDGRPGMTWVRIARADGTALPMPDGKKTFLGEFLQKHGKELPPEEYAIYKKWIAGVVPTAPASDDYVPY